MAPAGTRLVTLGYDFTAALGMARAMGIDRRAVAQLLPAIEGAMVRILNEDPERDG